jgi:hypothetical protein
LNLLRGAGVPVRVLPRRIAVVGTAGDRSDKELRELGWIVACHFNEVMIPEDDHLPGRSPGQLAALVAEGVQTAIDCGTSCQFVEPVPRPPARTGSGGVPRNITGVGDQQRDPFE